LFVTNCLPSACALLPTDAILTEVANGLSAVGRRGLAVALINAVLSTKEIEVVHVTRRFWERGWQLYQERPDKEWGLTDCLSFVVMEERSIREALTSDHHFEQAGFVRLIRMESP